MKDDDEDLHLLLPGLLLHLARTTVLPSNQTHWKSKERCLQLCPHNVAVDDAHTCWCIVARESRLRGKQCTLCGRSRYGLTQRRMYRELVDALVQHHRRWWLTSSLAVPRLVGQDRGEDRWGQVQAGVHKKRSPWYVDAVLLFEHGQVCFPILLELDGASHSRGDHELLERKRVNREHKIAACMHWCGISRWQFIVWKESERIVDKLNAAVNRLV